MGIFGKSKPEPQPVEIKGRALRCLVCSNGTFLFQRALMHGAASSFLDLEWTRPSADCAVCSECGYVHWFMPLDR